MTTAKELLNLMEIGDPLLNMTPKEKAAKLMRHLDAFSPPMDYKMYDEFVLWVGSKNFSPEDKKAVGAEYMKLYKKLSTEDQRMYPDWDFMVKTGKMPEAFSAKKEAEKIYKNAKVQAELKRLTKKWPDYNDSDEDAENVVDELDDFVAENGFLDKYSEDQAEEIRDLVKEMVMAGIT